MNGEKLRVKKKARNEGRLGYKKTKVGWIPVEWECDKIGKYIVLLSGQHVEAKNYNNEAMGIPYLTGPTDFQNGIPNASKFTEYPKVICNEKDILITCKGSGTGTLAVADKKYCISRQIMAIRASRINHYFALCLLKRAQSYFGKIAIGLIPGISRADILNFRIPLPPLPEQKKIAEILSAWDRAIEQVGKLIDAKQRLKKGLMQQLLSGKIRFPEFAGSEKRKVKSEKLRKGELPEGWRHVRIAEVAYEVIERNTEKVNYPVLSCSKYDGFVNSLEYFGKKVFSNDTSNYKLIKYGQFGFPSNHIEEGSIGLLYHVDVGIVSPIYIIFGINQDKVYAPFLYDLFKTDRYRHLFRINTNASVNRRGSLRWKGFSKIRVPLPSLAEQIRIAAVLSACDREIELLKKKKEKLQEQKKGLMQKLLTGEIRHPEFLKEAGK